MIGTGCETSRIGSRTSKLGLRMNRTDCRTSRIYSLQDKQDRL